MSAWNSLEGSWPRCSRCRKPVDTIERHADLGGRAGRLVFTLRCHGESETASLSYWDVERASSIAWAEAFQQPPAIVNSQPTAVP